MSLKNNLSDREKIMAWEAHRTMGHEQNDIAVLYCVNVGRVNEAITALDYALAHTRDLVQLARQDKIGEV